MLDLNRIRTPLIKGLKEATGNTVIMADQSGKPPQYPYFTLKILSAGQTVGQCTETVVEDDVVLSQATELVVSVTSYSDKLDQSFEDIHKAFGWFKGTGMYQLQEQSVAIVKVQPIDSRDNFVSIEFERRFGFDVRLRVTTQTQVHVGFIEHVGVEVIK
ncbi:hypothetical protein [Sporosarcina sp. P17b]|uniref:phage neck terminator protein n=1 Tax=Sporosarcina sp. P17b TaxID=2048260 RepID=UPI000C16E88B|nr:hypothetical protein [Sporosarcina sp. P17b]PIC73340.1 hypothetical protein CSV76_11015 [Sporosarcina sp. P17b]